MMIFHTHLFRGNHVWRNINANKILKTCFEKAQVPTSRDRRYAQESNCTGIWSRRWTVNLITAGGARRPVASMNKLFLNLNFGRKQKKNIYISRIWSLTCSKNIPKFEKMKIWEKKSRHSYEIFKVR